MSVLFTEREVHRFMLDLQAERQRRSDYYTAKKKSSSSKAVMDISDTSLYKICLKRVFDLLMAKTWNSCSINPFLNIPSKIADDLMKLTNSCPILISEVYLLLASGSLTHLDIGSLEEPGERDSFQFLIETNCFKSLRYFNWYSGENDILPMMENLVRSCPKLEEFHSANIFYLDVFQNCKKLRVIKIDVPPFFCSTVAEHDNLAALATLKNLQILSISYMTSDVVAGVLKHCANLVSLEHTDSLDGLEKIHANSGRKCETNCNVISNNFQLKRCVWGEHSLKSNPNITDIDSYKCKFPEKVKIAVSLCPFIEELIIYVSHPDSVESLKDLKHLACLKISFNECDGEYMTPFLALLKIIGPQLKFLSVDCIHPVPVDSICDCCPRLESLELARFATASKPQLSNTNHFMKNLRIMKVDRNALWFLLTSCKNLVELFFCDASYLDDNLLREILKWNRLAELKICEITESNLTKIGFRMILEKVVSLQRVHFAPFRRDVTLIFEDLITELNLDNVIYGQMFDIPYGAFGYIPSFFQS